MTIRRKTITSNVIGYEDKEIVVIELDAKEAETLRSAAEEIEYVTNSACEVFKMLHAGMATGFLGNKDTFGGMMGILDLSGRAMEHATNSEGRSLASFSVKLRDMKKDVSDVT